VAPMNRLISHLRSNVIAYLALFLALGGTAYAVSLPSNSVGTKQLKNNAVTKKKIKRNAVTTQKVRDATLLKKDFAPGVLTTGPTGPTGPAGTDTTLWAVVRAGFGTTPAVLVRGKGAVSVTRTSQGIHEVKFDRDVSGCSYYVNVSSDVPVIAMSLLAPTSEQAASKSGAPDTVMTSIATSGASGLDAPFHLLVAC
jgi:hypothetical protein